MLDLKVQYFQDSPPAGRPYREEHFIRRHVQMELPVDQTALVLVDLWDNHFIESWLERADRITREVVVPVLERARQTGLTIVHAPSSPVAESDWPPAPFRRRQGAYASFRGPRAQPPGIPPIDALGMSSHIDVQDGEHVVATGDQLHDLLRANGSLHLVYVGFATNWCILNRDYGMRAMAQRGYNMILLRDATMGVMFPDTLAAEMATEMAIREVGQQLGFSATKDDFLAACAGYLGCVG